MPRLGFSVYLITDQQQTLGRPLLAVLDEALTAGIKAVQIRERNMETRALLRLAEQIGELARRHGATVFVNDRIDLALAAGAHGVHLRADSLPVGVARRLVGAGKLIGVSAHSADEAVRAAEAGADFAVLGPVYDTPSKRAFGPPIGLRVVQEASRRVRVPVLAIGGVTAARVPELLRAGAAGVAVIGAVLSAPDVSGATRALLDAASPRLYS